jgi:hypothetical protein
VSDWKRQHGELDAASFFRVKCDAPGCGALSPLPSIGTRNDFENRARTRVVAEANGWYVALDRGAKNKNWDLCPDHAPPRGAR